MFYQICKFVLISFVWKQCNANINDRDRKYCIHLIREQLQQNEIEKISTLHLQNKQKIHARKYQITIELWKRLPCTRIRQLRRMQSTQHICILSDLAYARTNVRPWWNDFSDKNKKKSCKRRHFNWAQKLAGQSTAETKSHYHFANNSTSHLHCTYRMKWNFLWWNDSRGRNRSATQKSCLSRNVWSFVTYLTHDSGKTHTNGDLFSLMMKTKFTLTSNIFNKHFNLWMFREKKPNSIKLYKK